MAAVIGEENEESKRKSLDIMEELQRQGLNERWAIKRSEIIITDPPFARGAGGELFRAKWRGLDCVAKTCLVTGKDQVLIDLANEIRVLSTLRHPHLVMFLGACFETGKPPTLLMEYCPGGNLEAKLCKLDASATKMKLKVAIDYTYQLALAMNFLHQCVPPVVHRDLKPSNILITKDNQIKVTDFGLSKFIPKRHEAQHDKYTMTGETGSYRFMAPEVFRHEEYNEKVDVYSFGLIVYWMMAGERPFADIPDPVEAAKAAALKQKKPYDSAVKHDEIRAMLKQCWSAIAEERPSFESILEKITIVREESKNKNDSCTMQ